MKKVKLLQGIGLFFLFCFLCGGLTCRALADEEVTSSNETVIEDEEEEKKDSADELFDRLNQTKNEQLKETEKRIKVKLKIADGAWDGTFKYIMNGYRVFMQILWILVVVLMVSGLIVFFCARKNKRVRRFGLYGLCAGIPLGLIAIGYGTVYVAAFILG